MPEEVLAVQASVTECLLAPIAEREVVGELAALLTNEKLPVTPPPALGSKVMLKLAFCPEANVKGKVWPETLNPAPVTAAWEITTLVVPLLVTTTGRTLLLPMVMFPKLKLDGLSESDVMEPVPESEMAVGELEAVLTTEMLPVELPEPVGEKAALRFALWPAARVRGKVRPLTPNPVPEADA